MKSPSRELRNKMIAIEALMLLSKVTPEPPELEELYQRWEKRGVRWLRPELSIVHPDDWLSAAAMAEHVDVDAATIRRWHYRGHITSMQGSDGRAVFNVGDVLRYRARRGL